MNIFTNLITLGFYFFTKYANRRFSGITDPSTGEHLTEKNRKWEFRKVLELPWVFWCVMAFTMFETSTAIVFTANATELAEQRFDISSIKAGWYTSLLQYAGFFVVPAVGIFIDVWGNRITLSLFPLPPSSFRAERTALTRQPVAFCGIGVFISMALLNWASATAGTAAAFGIYAVAYSFGPTVIIDSVRTSMHSQTVFGAAYALKITINNAFVSLSLFLSHLPPPSQPL